MPALKDLCGQQIGRLTVLRQAPTIETKGGNRTRQIAWICRCKCGALTTVRAGHLTNQHTKSCGCLRKDTAVKYGRLNATHGKKHTRIYSTWQSMKNRCYAATHKSFHQYGGRGIKVCARWMTFENFYADMGERPEGKTLDRYPNKSGNYEPGNCRWATTKEQATNKITNRRVQFNGKNLTISEWSVVTGIPNFTIKDRLDRGWSARKSLTVDPAIYRKSHNHKDPDAIVAEVTS